MGTFNAMKLQIGQYHYGRHHKNIGIWVCTSVSENRVSSDFVKDVNSWEEAKEFVYRMNGWNK